MNDIKIGDYVKISNPLYDTHMKFKDMIFKVYIIPNHFYEYYHVDGDENVKGQWLPCFTREELELVTDKDEIMIYNL